MDKYKNKYRIPSARLQNWDYGSNAAYFVTICTRHREHYFGEIAVETGRCPVSTTQLSEIGLLAKQYWEEIPIHFPFVNLGAFVIMPNHVHGIIIIDKPVETRQCLVSTAMKPEITIGKKRFQNQGKNTLSSIIGSYKSVVTKNARQIHANFAWQSRFHDHIIRSGQSFQNITNYIEKNSLNWQSDKFYPTKQTTTEHNQ